MMVPRATFKGWFPGNVWVVVDRCIFVFPGIPVLKEAWQLKIVLPALAVLSLPQGLELGKV